MSLARIRGQARALRLLGPMLASRNLPPALLFFGPEGVGKATTAGELAKALNCLSPAEGGDACDACSSCAAAAKGIDPDLKRVNAHYQAGLREEEVERQRTLRVDTIRHLLKDVEMTSLTGRWKVAILEDAERLEIEAANALLKSLEEPPARTLWILVTGRRDRVLPTILSRCHRVGFGTLPAADASAVLAATGLPLQEVQRLAKLSEGSPGRALKLRQLELPEPEEWLKDPMGPIRLPEKLPRELHLARPIVEAHLRRIAWRLRDHARRGRPGAEAAQKELSKLSSWLKSNADPRLVLQLACLELERVP